MLAWSFKATLSSFKVRTAFVSVIEKKTKTKQTKKINS